MGFQYLCDIVSCLDKLTAMCLIKLCLHIYTFNSFVYMREKFELKKSFMFLQDIFECKTCGLTGSLCCCTECAKVINYYNLN